MSSTSHNNHSVDDHILAQLAPLQSTIFTSFQGGDDALCSFKESWTSFKKTYDTCSSILLDETRTAVESFALLLHTISSALLASELIHEQYEKDIAQLADVEFKKLSINDKPETISTPQAPYIKSCYIWLLNNLHNPYPSKVLRARIADETDYDVRDIDAWFIDARRRIGWNRLRRAHFETRADMVKAATRHFKPNARATRPGPYNCSSQPEDASSTGYTSYFVAMEADAQALYSHKFFPTALATDIDSTMRLGQDATSSYPSPARTPSRDVERTRPSPPVDNSADKRRKRRSSETDSCIGLADGGVGSLRPLKRSRIASPSFVDSNAVSSLPSPSPSFHRGVSCSLLPSVAASPVEEDIRSSLVTGKRKRRASDATEYDSESSDIVRIRRKRRGGDVDVESGISTSMSPLLQKRSLMGILSAPQPSVNINSSPISNRPLEQSTSRKRKRRLSDAEGDRAPKHPSHAALMVPRLQTVSNPLPLSSFLPSVDDDVPSNLSTEVPDFTETVNFDLSQNVEIEVFDYTSLPIFSDYMSQVNSVPSNPDNSQDTDSITGNTPEIQCRSVVQGPANVAGAIPILEFDFTSDNALSLHSYADLFSHIQVPSNSATPEVWHNYSSTSDQQIFTSPDQASKATSSWNTTVLPTHPSGFNPSSLLLYPQGIMESANIIVPTMSADPFINIPSVPSLDDAAVTSFALQEIEKLQAQLQMYQARLAQVGLSPF